MSQLEQPELRLSRRAEKKQVAVDLVMRQPSFSKAIALCVQLSGLAEKEVCLELDVDAGHWTRIMKGEGHFPVDKINALMELCGNQAPLIWLAHSNGFGLVMMKSELERQLEQVTIALQKERDRSQILADVLQGRA